MRRNHLLATACALVTLLTASAASAQYTGPVQGAAVPGGVNVAVSGVSATQGTRIWTYTPGDLSATGDLFWGLTPTQAAMDYSINSLGETLTIDPTSNLLGGLATLRGTTTVNLFGNNTPVFTRLNLSVTDLANNPLALSTNLTEGPFGSGLFPVLDVQGAFIVRHALEASFQLNGSYSAISPFYNNLSGKPPTPGGLVTSVGAAFFYSENVSPGVPEPATWAMLIVGFGAVGGAMRASRRRVGKAAIA